MNLNVRVELGSHTHVAIAGELDAACVAFLEGLFGVLSRARSSRVVLDLSRVGFMDCTGLRVLLTARRLTTAGGGVLHLTSVPERVRRVILLTGTGFLLTPA